MSNYSNNPAHCRADIFKLSGKWYATEVIDMVGHYDDNSILDAVKHAVYAAVGSRFKGMLCVVLEPYHFRSYPIMFTLE